MATATAVKKTKKTDQPTPTRLVQTAMVDGAELGVFGVMFGGQEIRGVTRKDGDSVSITFVAPSADSSFSYLYRSASGTVERREKFDGDWIGSITVSLTSLHRIKLVMDAFICDQFKLPTTTDALKDFIDSRPEEKKVWWIVGDAKKLSGGICLPNLLNFYRAVDASLLETPDTAVITNVTVAPEHQKKGYGTLLHLFLAQYLRDEGFKCLTSDVVGMNTSGELAIWKRLKKRGAKIKRTTDMSICVPRFLHGINIIEDGMYKILNEHCASHFGDREYKLGELENMDFPQYEWDLSKPVLTA